MANLKLVKSATALVLGASVLTSAVAVSGTDASAKTTYKVTKKGYLVNAKTNKAVKGYKSYKGKLYKNGKKFTGTYKSVFYKSGVKFTGTYNKKYYVKGKLFTGKTSKNVYYKKGVKFTGVTSYGYTYKDGKRVEGEYKGKVYKNGKLFTGLYKDVLYTKGVKETGLDLYKEKLYKDGVLNVGLALFQDKLYKDAGLANGVIEFNNDTNAYENGVVVPTSVVSASAVNQSEITLSGAALGKLKVADITVAGVKVKEVKPSADWKTATVTLDGTLTPNTDKTVTVKVGTDTKEFTVNYKFGPQAVAVSSQTFDDDTANQFVKIKVDGVQTAVDYLKTAGYTVEFNAYNAKTGVKDNSIFKNTSTGELAADLTSKVGEYNVQVVVSKGATVLTSEKASITISNIDNAATTAKKYTLTTQTTGVEVESGILAIGESADFTDVYVTDGENTVKIGNTAFTVKSSDSSVISVGSDNRTITATGLGTAVVTIQYGNVKQEVTLTVKGEQRKLVKVSASNKTAIVGAGSSLTAYLLDQYGDVYTKAASVVVSYPAIDGLPTADETKTVAATDGYFTVALPVTKGGQSGTIVYRDADKNILGQTTVTTSAVNNQVSKEVYYNKTVAGYSTDDSINANDELDNKISYGVRYLTSEGLVNGTVSSLTGYTVKFDNKVIAINGVSTSDTQTIGATGSIEVTPIKAGTTTLSIYDTNNNLVASKTITVSKGQPEFSSVSWIAPTEVNYTGTFGLDKVLKVVESNGDDIVEGIALTSAPSNKIRVTTSSVTIGSTTYPAGTLYVDVDGKASLNAGDVPFAKVTTSVASSDSSIAAASGLTYTLTTGANGTITYAIESLDSTKTFVTKAVKVKVAKSDSQLAAAQAAADAKAFKENADVVTAVALNTADVATFTTAQKTAIANAQAQLNKLSAAAKTAAGADAVKVQALTDAVADNAAVTAFTTNADVVTAVALNTADVATFTTAQKTAIANAQAELDKLTATQKTAAGADATKVQALTDAVAVNAFKTNTDVVTAVALNTADASTFTAAQKTAIANAQAELDKLTAAQKTAAGADATKVQALTDAVAAL